MCSLLSDRLLSELLTEAVEIFDVPRAGFLTPQENVIRNHSRTYVFGTDVQLDAHSHKARGSTSPDAALPLGGLLAAQRLMCRRAGVIAVLSRRATTSSVPF